MGFHFKAAIGSKEADQMPSQRMLELARGAQLAKVAKLFFHFGIERLQTDFVVSEAGDFAARKDVDGKIYGDCAGMKKVKRPKIESAAGQVNPALSRATANSWLMVCARIGSPGLARPTADSSSGARRSWPTRSAGSSPARAGTPRRSSSPPATPASRKRPVATGRSSATAASMRTR